jgi:hypothetical protein
MRRPVPCGMLLSSQGNALEVQKGSGREKHSKKVNEKGRTSASQGQVRITIGIDVGD